jgi:hypothetical protein
VKTTGLLLFAFLSLVPSFLMGQPMDTSRNINPDNLKLWERKAMNQLLVAGMISVSTGIVMMHETFGQNYDQGIQHLAWGVINTTIAGLAHRGISKRDYSSIDLNERASKMKKILGINVLLDVLYVGAGTALLLSNQDQLMGHGRGVLIQGSFLLLFDAFHWKQIQRIQKEALRF